MLKNFSLDVKNPSLQKSALQNPALQKTRLKRTILNQILLGDSLQILRQMPGNITFDLVIADPPYNIGKNFGNNRDRRRLTDYIEWSVEWINLCLQRLKKNGLMYVYGFPEILAHIAVQFPLEKQKWLVWHYTNKTVPSLKFWQRSHETLICLWKDLKRPNLEIDQIREPYTKAYKNCIGKARKPTRGRFGAVPTIYHGHKNGALPRDVLKTPALAGGKGLQERSPLRHPTQKPLALSERLLKSRIKAGHTGQVLVPFAGSGSECVMAKKLGIDFLGIEINPLYARSARQWINNVAD